MCATCGCLESTQIIPLEVDVLAKNNDIARHVRSSLASRNILAINVMSSPGAGKTTLLERTIRALDVPVSVIEGDQATEFDADRVRATGCAAVQINTGAGCHLDATMVHNGLHELDPPSGSVLLIENVGNLVCPALFDLGEAFRVLITSVTEGADKPRKYPHMFTTADLVLLNKVDLLPYVDFSVERFVSDAQLVRPGVPVMPLSATVGTGVDAWLEWLRDQCARVCAPAV